jgi:putative ABC transport system permease protein
MSAVWRASRAAVKRRRLQTFAIGFVVLLSTTTVLLALGLLAAASAPFDQAFTQQRGAHAVATFDAAKTSPAQLRQTAQRPGVQAAAGPFEVAVLEFSKEFLWMPPGTLAVAGRADPAGPVDRLELVSGRWATAPGEIVVNWPLGGQGGPDVLGVKLNATDAPTLTVVGFATSMSRSADAWVTPAQVAELHPTARQMLYRFTAAATDRQVSTGLATVTAGLPADALSAAQSYLTLKRAFSVLVDAYLPFMIVFGVLGLLVSGLIVANVVSGAVVSGYRHIGVLKALGFTPNQVVAVYLAMVGVPAIVGCALGTLFGTLLSPVILKIAFSGIPTGTAAIGAGPWVWIVGMLGVLVLVFGTALIPALRARRLSAAKAISAGSAPRAGRGLPMQRMLSGTRLPRPISLGLGLPFARPGRAVMTMAAIVLGVATVTLTTGLTSTMVAYSTAGNADGAPQIDVQVGSPARGQIEPELTDAQIEAQLRSLPGARRVTARALLDVRLVGHAQPLFANFYRGDSSTDDEPIVTGRPPAGPGEVAAGPAFLAQRGLEVGDRITLDVNDRRVPVTIVGQLMGGSDRAVDCSWLTLALFAPDTEAIEYSVTLAPGADADAYVSAVKAADPGLYPSVAGSVNAATGTVVSFSTVFTLLLTIVAALGVFNTVLLTTRERRRDFGMLKSIGMTPRQVVVMTVTSVAAPGAASGLLAIPIGIIAHRLIVDNVAIVAFPEYMKNVWHVPQLAGLALAGVAIAVVGALIPARSAARLTIAAVLHNE